MTTEHIKLSLSAMMDDSAEELELRRVLANADDEIMATWSRYQTARSIMRKEAFFPTLDIASSVSKVIREEENEAIKSSTQSNVDGLKRRIFPTLSKMAVVASVLAVMVSSVYFFNNIGEVTFQDDYVKTEQAEATKVATYDQWEEQRLSDFVERHEQHGVSLEYINGVPSHEKVEVN